MVEPSDRSEGSLVAKILAKIPGFGGYIKQESRQESDSQTRAFLVSELQKSKANLDQYARALVDAVRLDDVAQVEKCRGDLEKIILQLKSHVPGYSSFFGSPKFDEDQLEDVYDMDVNLINDSEDLTDKTQQLANSKSSDDFQSVIQQVSKLKAALSEREKLLDQLS